MTDLKDRLTVAETGQQHIQVRLPHGSHSISTYLRAVLYLWMYREVTVESITKEDIHVVNIYVRLRRAPRLSRIESKSKPRPD
jgi:hypothetical protein